MITINGNNYTYNAEEIYDSIIVNISRTITSESNDYLPSFVDMINTLCINTKGQFAIFNESDTYNIIINITSNCTLIPGPTDIIYPKTWKTYTFNILDNNIEYSNLSFNGTDIITSKIVTSVIESTNTNIRVGNTGNNINLKGPLTVYGNIYKFISVSYLNASTNLTYSVGQIIGSFIKRDCGSANRNDTLPSSAGIISNIPNVDIGTSFTCSIQNVSSSNKYVRILPGTNMTISGNDVYIYKDKLLNILFVVTDIDTPSITAYLLGYVDSSGGAASLIKNINNISQLPYTILSTDNTINVDTKTIKSQIILNLPKITENKYYFITDSTGNASIYSIKIIPYTGDTIMGNTSLVINSNYTSISLYNNESDTWLVY